MSDPSDCHSLAYLTSHSFFFQWEGEGVRVQVFFARCVEHINSVIIGYIAESPTRSDSG